MGKLWVVICLAAACWAPCNSQLNLLTSCYLIAQSTGDTSMRCVTGGACPIGDVEAGISCKTGQICCKRAPPPPCGVEEGLVTTRALVPDVDSRFANPWVVRLGFNTLSWCSGVLISDQVIVTDATCAVFCQNLVTPGLCKAFVGDYDVTSSDAYKVELDVTNIIIHEDTFVQTYNDAADNLNAGNVEPLLANSVALIKLSQPVSRGPGVNVPCDPRGYDALQCLGGCKVASFGINDPTNPVTNVNTRQVLTAKTIDDDVCRFHRNYSSTPNATHCGFVQKDGAGLCFGDNGGAFVCLDPGTGRWTLEGLVEFRPADSYGAGYDLCSDQIFVYSDMASLWPWIQSKLAII